MNFCFGSDLGLLTSHAICVTSQIIFYSWKNSRIYCIFQLFFLENAFLIYITNVGAFSGPRNDLDTWVTFWVFFRTKFWDIFTIAFNWLFILFYLKYLSILFYCGRWGFVEIVRMISDRLKIVKMKSKIKCYLVPNDNFIIFRN